MNADDPTGFPGSAVPRLQSLASLLLRLEDTNAPADAGAAAELCEGLARDCTAAGLLDAARLATSAGIVFEEVREKRAPYSPELNQAVVAALDGLASAMGFGPPLPAAAAECLCAALEGALPGAAPVAVDWPGPARGVSADLVGQFTTEAAESIHEAESALLELERNPAHGGALARLFRSVHSLKGTADYAGLSQIKVLAHRLEDVLSAVRAGRLALAGCVELVLAGFDHLKAMVAALTPDGEADRDLGAFIASLAAVAGAGPRDEPAADVLSAAFSAAAEQHIEGITAGLRALAAGDSSDETVSLLRRAAGSLNTAAAVAQRGEFDTPTADLLAMVARLMDAQGRLAAHTQEGAWPPAGAASDPPAPVKAPKSVAPVAPRPAAPEAAPEPEARRAPADTGPAAADAGRAPAAGKTMRVDQRKLDEYLNLAGELVIARNSLSHAFRRCPTDWAGARGLKEAVAKVDRIVGDLQNNAMGMRMVPVGTVFQRLPRLIRDVARTLGKRIELQTFGEETELDKQVAEALSDPLVHLVRNSADHGIEPAEARLAAGKAEAGTVTLRAGREGNAIFIDIEDDGGGINVERLKAKALSTGVITAEQAATMSRGDAMQLIFAAGLSTAKEVSDISGRGVGMDVVRNNIAALGGSVEVHSEPGQGTRIRLSLPLTLAVTTVVLVESGGTLFGLPMDAVKETVKVAPDTLRQLRGTAAMALRGEVIPLRPLPGLLATGAPEFRPPEGRIPVVVLSVAGSRFGVMVDALRGQQEIVLKPVPPQLGQIDGVGGATIMGDGSVVLILDPSGLYRTALSAEKALSV